MKPLEKKFIGFRTNFLAPVGLCSLEKRFAVEAKVLSKCTNQPGPNPIKVFSASIEATLKFQPIKLAIRPFQPSLIG